MDWSVIVPVKRLAEAKSRLAGSWPRLDAPEFALAFALDTVAAVLAADGVAMCLVVCDDPLVTAALTRAGASVIGQGGAVGLNAAVARGAEHLRRGTPTSPVAVLPSDLPALRPAELTAALAVAAAYERAFLPDSAGIGTTLLTADGPGGLRPQYGGQSARAHAAGGARRLTGRWPSLQTDVDTRADLRGAELLGLGPATRAMIATLVC